MNDCTCSKHCVRSALCKALDGFCNRKASMTLVAFGVILLVCFLGGKFPTIDGNLPTILGAIVGVLTAFLGGHIFDSKWSPTAAPGVEKKDLPAVAKAIVKEVAKKEEEKEEGS